MKVLFFGTAVLAILVGVSAGALSPAGAQAKSFCQANPSPVDATDPSIIVTSPTADASVASPIHVTGQARVFEATVSLKLFDATGTELVSTTTNAAEGQTLSPFSVDVAFSVTSDTPACLWVFEASARDGEPVNVVQIPLTLRPAGLPPTGTGGQTESGPVLAWLVAGLAVAGAGLTGAGWLGRRRTI